MIAIHHRPGSFSDRWIEYCNAHGVPYKIVNCFDSDIVEQLKDCEGLMWHWAHHDHKAVLFARQLTYALEQAGKKVFPNSKTVWHFDDKVGQKYLLESIGAPLVKSWVFYDEDKALEWTRTTAYPVVFKLRGGAGSENVRLVRSQNHAARLIRKAFHKGFKQKNRVYFLKERIWHVRRDRSLVSLLNISRGIGRLFVPTKSEVQFPRDRGYAYFQTFLSANRYDTRIIVVGDRAFAFRRMMREGDFRASGSGRVDYDPAQIDQRSIRNAFEIAIKLGSQCVAFDFLFDDAAPQVIEISYTFAYKFRDYPGYWTRSGAFVECAFRVEDFMIEDFLASLERSSNDG
jgi:hypothetical protein